MSKKSLPYTKTKIDWLLMAGIVAVSGYGACRTNNFWNKILNPHAQELVPVESEHNPERPITRKLHYDSILTMSAESYIALNKLEVKDYAFRGVEGCFDKDDNLDVPFAVETVTEWKPYYSSDEKKCGAGTALILKEKR